MRKISIGLLAAGTGMSLAVSLLMLFLASVVKNAFVQALCVFVASLMTWIPLREERGYLFALIEFVLTSAIALLIARGTATYLYVLLFGHYAIVRFFLRTRMTDRLLTVLIRFLVLNVLTALGIVLSEYVFGVSVAAQLPNLSVFPLVAILEAAFAVFMLLFKVFSLLFDSAFRNMLMPRR